MTSERPPICNYEGSDYQATFWDSGERAYEDQVEAIALKRLLPPGGDLLLELGAGAGRNTPRYSAFNRVVLLDYSLSQLRLAQERLGRDPRYTYVAADAYRLPFIEGVFDAATMIRTLHHIVSPPQVLSQVRRVLRNGAIFILEYANKRNLKAIMRYLARRQNWSPFSLEPVEFAALNFDFHPSAIRQWLETSDFKVERQLTVSHFRQRGLKRAVPLRLLVQMDALAQWTGNLWQATPSVFVRARAGTQGDIKLITDRRDRIGDQPGEAETNASISAIFICPECSAPLREEGEEILRCTVCSAGWAIHDGIYDFRQPA
jgi:ubiquinone/menaquinone biosynthesis C-methylase UbiE